jgi:hypothetical protein
VDEFQQVLGALERAAVERDQLHQHWRQRLERAQYESQRAERYQGVEPENRLVARTLEQRWDESLRQERQLREEYDRFVVEMPASLSEADVELTRRASQNISALWRAVETTPQDRKAIVPKRELKRRSSFRRVVPGGCPPGRAEAPTAFMNDPG